MTQFIDQEKDNHTVQTMCEVLDVPRSTYYKSLNKTVSNHNQENQRLPERFIEIYNDSKHRYGVPKIHHLMLKECDKVSHQRVQRLMKKAGIQSIIVKKFRSTPSKEMVVERENILERDFSTAATNKNRLLILPISIQ